MTVSTIPHPSSAGPPSETGTSQPGQYSAASYRRREDHKPRTTTSEEEHYVLTLQTDPTHHATMSSLRKKYFPANLLKVDAHISLFRALPGSMLSTIKTDIASTASQTTPFPVSARKPFRMARGVSVSVVGLEPAEVLFKTLQDKWYHVLSQQDRGRFRGHYTLMNKVDDENIVLKCLEELRRDFKGCPGEATGLTLWRYDRGWWRHDQTFDFIRNQV